MQPARHLSAASAKTLPSKTTPGTDRRRRQPTSKSQRFPRCQVRTPTPRARFANSAFRPIPHHHVKHQRGNATPRRIKRPARLVSNRPRKTPSQKDAPGAVLPSLIANRPLSETATSATFKIGGNSKTPASYATQRREKITRLERQLASPLKPFTFPLLPRRGIRLSTESCPKTPSKIQGDLSDCDNARAANTCASTSRQQFATQ